MNNSLSGNNEGPLMAEWFGRPQLCDMKYTVHDLEDLFEPSWDELGLRSTYVKVVHT